MFIHTPYHTAIAESVIHSNVVVKASPGSGKTTSIKEVIITALLKQYHKGGAIAFNGKNAADLKNAIASPFVECSTVHSALYKCLKNHMSIKPELEQKAGFNKFKKHMVPALPGKTENITNILNKSETVDNANIMRLVDLMKANALGLPGYPAYNDKNAIREIIASHGLAPTNDNGELMDCNELMDISINVFASSIKANSTVDFTDMLYFPLYFNANLPDWDFLVYDEAQDIKPIEFEFLKRMHSKGCRLVLVGDGFQAINHFTGCLKNALDVAVNDLNAIQLNLPVSYRVSIAAAAEANNIFNDSIIPWDGAKNGSVSNLTFPELDLSNLNYKDGLLSRTHKNLMPLALKFLSEKSPFTYKGIAELVGKMERMLFLNSKVSHDLTSIIRGLQEYQAELEEKNVNSNGSVKPWVILAGETSESLCNLLAYCNSQGETLAHAKQYLKLLADCDKASSGPTLSTLHASKGLQWENVYLLGEMVSSRATTDEQMFAETCLKYVGLTRSSDNIIYVTL